MSEKEKNIVPSTAEAEMSEEEKQKKLLEQFDKESKTRNGLAISVKKKKKKAYRVCRGVLYNRYLISSGFPHPVFTCVKAYVHPICRGP